MEKIKKLFVLKNNPILAFIVWNFILTFEFFDNLDELQPGDFVKYNWRARVCLPLLAKRHEKQNNNHKTFLVRGVYRMREDSYHMHVDFERPRGVGSDTMWLTKIKRKNLYG